MSHNRSVLFRYKRLAVRQRSDLDRDASPASPRPVVDAEAPVQATENSQGEQGHYVKNSKGLKNVHRSMDANRTEFTGEEVAGGTPNLETLGGWNPPLERH